MKAKLQASEVEAARIQGGLHIAASARAGATAQ